MAKKQENEINSENLIKTILGAFDIATKSDITELQNRVDKLERLIVRQKTMETGKAAKYKKRADTATSTVLKEINKYHEGTNFKTIQTATGFEERKLRNIIFRLDKFNKIKKIARGKYAKA
jgi:hypothetical protein